MRADIDKLGASYAEIVKSDSTTDISKNIVIRNLPESQNENVMAKVNVLFRDGLKLQNVQVSKVERKKAFRDNDHGIVVATCASSEQKKQIMSAKSVLQKSRRFEKVFIEHDRSKEERLYISNMKTLVNNLGSDRLSVKGNRIVSKHHAVGRGNQMPRDRPTDRNSRVDRHLHNGDGKSGGRSMQGRGNGNASERGSGMQFNSMNTVTGGQVRRENGGNDSGRRSSIRSDRPSSSDNTHRRN